MNEKKVIRITVEGGLIQHIEGIPDDVKIIVKDYDVDGIPDDELYTDKDGDKCNRYEW